MWLMGKERVITYGEEKKYYSLEEIKGNLEKMAADDSRKILKDSLSAYRKENTEKIIDPENFANYLGIDICYDEIGGLYQDEIGGFCYDEIGGLYQDESLDYDEEVEFNYENEMLGFNSVDRDGKNIIVIDNECSEQKAREVIMYNIAHFLLTPSVKRYKPSSINYIYNENSESDYNKSLSEKVVDKFVYKALMPKKYFIKRYEKEKNINKVESLANHFGVTNTLAYKRIEQLQLEQVNF